MENRDWDSEIDAARAALRLHASDPQACAADRRLAGPAVAPAVWLSLVLFGAVLWWRSSEPWTGVLALFLAWRLARLLLRDWRLYRARLAHDPARAARIYWEALVWRVGLAFSQLAPSVRGQRVPPPRLPDALEPDSGEVPALSDPASLSEWATAFARPGPRRYGGLTVRRVEIHQQAADFAVTRATLRASASAYCVAPFAVLAMVVMPWPGLLFAVLVAVGHRRTADIVLDQRWLRGQDQRWYLLDPAGRPAR